MSLSSEFSCKAGSFSRRLNLTGFSVRGFEAFFPHTGTLGCTVCLAPGLSACKCISRSASRLACHRFSSRCLARSPVHPAAHLLPPTSLDDCFFFNSLVVRLPYSSTFWQFWLFFVFKSVVILLLVVQGNKIYLSAHPSWPEAQTVLLHPFTFFIQSSNPFPILPLSIC